MFNNACEFAYQVVSPNLVRIHEVSDEAQTGFPYENFPSTLPQHPVTADGLTYEQQKTLVYAFTVRDLCDDAISESDQHLIESLRYPFPQVGGIQQLSQGIPDQQCPNWECRDYRSNIQLNLFAIVWNEPIHNFKLWGEFAEESQIIFQVCSSFRSILVCNRCG